MKRLSVLFVMGYMVSVSMAHAATYYVSKNGSDNNTCTQAQSISTPKLTVTAGLTCLRGGGDTLFIRAGTYAERIKNNVPSGSSWTSKVRIANYNGETVWLYPPTGEGAISFDAGQQYIEFDGINARHNSNNSVISVFGTAHHIRWQNATIIGGTGTSGGSANAYSSTNGNEFVNLDISGTGGPYGIYVDGGDGALIDGCRIHHVASGGIHVYSDNRAAPTNLVIRNTRIDNITQSFFFGAADNRIFGILIGGSNTQVYNNLIHDLNLPGAKSGEAAIVVGSGSGNRIWNNTLTNNVATGGIKVDAAGVNTEVRNNIAWRNTGAAFQNSGSNTQQSNNLFEIDPLFANPSGKDFQLTAASRAVDAGANLSVVRTDLSGTARPQGSTHDIGAYEYHGQPAASGPPAPPTGVRIVSN